MKKYLIWLSICLLYAGTALGQTATLSNVGLPPTVCLGGQAQLQVDIAGIPPPWSVAFTDGTNLYLESNINSSPHIFNFTPLSTGVQFLQLIQLNGFAPPNVQLDGFAIVRVDNPNSITLTANSNSPVCAGQPLALATGGDPIFNGTYSWTGPNGFTSNLQNPTIPAATVANAGTYSVTVSLSGCTIGPTTTQVNIIDASNAPAAGSNGPITESQTLFLFTETIPGATYNWTGPNGFTSNVQNPSIPNATPAASGVYSVTYSVAGCTSAQGTINVVVNPIIQVFASIENIPGTNELCEGDFAQISIDITGPGSPYTVVFTDGTNNYTESGIIVAPYVFEFVPIGSGTKTFTLVSVNGITPPQADFVGSATYNISPLPTTPLVASANAPVCTGSTLNLSATSYTGATYAWTGPNGFSSALQNPTIPNVTAAEAGSYGVTVTLGECIVGPSNVDVTLIDAGFTPTVSNSSPLATGATLFLSATTYPGATYAWTGPNSFSSNEQNPSIANVNVFQAGQYSLTVTTGACVSTQVTTDVVINASNGLSALLSGNTTACLGAKSGQLTVQINGGTPPYSVGFTDGVNLYLEQNINSSPHTFSFTPVGTVGTKTLTLIQVNGFVPPDVDLFGQATVNVVAAPNITPAITSNSPVCSGQSLNLTATAAAGATYAWTGPNNFTSTLQSPTVPNMGTINAGEYSVSITVNNCTLPEVKATVVVNPTPTVCINDLTQPNQAGGNGSITASASNGLAPYNYALDGLSFIHTTGNFSSLAPGTYAITAKDANGCTAVSTTKVIISFGNAFVVQNIHGGTASEVPSQILPTDDGGIIQAGFTQSYGTGGQGMFIERLNADGSINWSKCIGGTADDIIYSIIPTPDKGYFLVGATQSFGAGQMDAFAVKTDANGTPEWAKAYGAGNDELGLAACQGYDGGYLVAGRADVPGNQELFIVKTDANGNEQFTAIYGDANQQSLSSLLATCDGGYLLVGTTHTGNNVEDILVIKTDANLNTTWSKTYDAGGGDDEVSAVIETVDGGYLLAGRYLNGANYDNLLLKIDAQGNVSWAKRMDGLAANDRIRAVTYTNDDQYVIAGVTGGFGAGGDDAFLSKIDASGNILWSRAYGGTNDDGATGVVSLPEGGYAVAGYYLSGGAGGFDIYYLRTDANGGTNACSVTDAPFAVSNLTYVAQDFVQQPLPAGTTTTTFAPTVSDVSPTFGDVCTAAVVPTGTLTANATAACLGQPIILTVNLTGTAPWDIAYSENGGTAIDVFDIASSPFTITVTPAGVGTYTYTLTLVTDANANGTAIGSPVVTVGPPVQLCDVKATNASTAGGTGSILATASGGSGAPYTYSLDGINFNNTTGLFTNVTPGIYTVYAKDVIGCTVGSAAVKVFAYTDPVAFQKTAGGFAAEIGYSATQTIDAGYIIAGSTESFGAGGTDIYIVKTDALGNPLWSRTFGGTNNERAISIQQTKDGGYIVSGVTESFGAGNTDALILKIDANGNQLWSRTYGNVNFDEAHSVIETLDGGYAFTGPSADAGNSEVYLVKLDALGNETFTHIIGNSGTELPRVLLQSCQGGYIIGGTTTGQNGSEDILLIRTDDSGNLVYTYAYGSTTDNERGLSMAQASNGDILLAGDIVTNNNRDVLLMRTNSTGTPVFAKIYSGGGDFDAATVVAENADKSIMLSGFQNSFGGGTYDAFLAKTDESGILIWARAYGGADEDYVGFSAAPTADGGYFTSGSSRSFGVGDFDMSLIKTDAQGRTPGCPQVDITYTMNNLSFTANTWTNSPLSGATIINNANNASTPVAVQQTAICPVVFLPSATLSGNSAPLCAGQLAILTVNFTGTPPWSFTYTENGTNPITLNSIAFSPFSLTVSPTAIGNTTYALTDMSDINTTGNVVGNIILTVNSAPTLMLKDKVDASCTQAGSFTVVASGGTGSSYTYSLDGVNYTNTTGIFTNMPSGGYSVTARDEAGCVSAPLDLIINANNNTISISLADKTDPTCETKGSLTFKASGGPADAVYEFALNSNVFDNTTGTYSNLDAGTYAVTARYGTCLSTTLVVDLTQTAGNLNITLVDKKDNDCNGAGFIRVSASGGQGNYTYDIGNATFINTSGNFVGLTAGVYTVSVKSGNCTASINVQIFNDANSVQITLLEARNAGCPGNDGRIRVTGSGGIGGSYTYSIDGINFNNTTGIFATLVPGNYTVYVRNGNCTASIPVTLTGLTPPTITDVIPNPNAPATSLNVTWTAVTGAIRYNLRYRVAGSTVTPTLINNIIATSRTITGLAANTNYEFSVQAVCANGNISAFSPLVIGTTGLDFGNNGCAIPGIPSVQVINSTSALITWNANVPNAVCYVVSYGPATANPSLWPQFLVNAPGSSLLAVDLLPGTQYSVRIRTNCSLCAVNAGIRSSWSAAVNFVTPSGGRFGNTEVSNLAPTNIAVYPNPNRGNFNLDVKEETAGSLRLDLVDVTGKTVYQSQFDYPAGGFAYPIELNGLAAGIYHLRVTQNDKLFTIKLVIQ